jgi:hypothetical protein
MTTVNPSQTGLDGAGAPTSKKGLKKQQKEAEKAKRKAEVAAKLVSNLQNSINVQEKSQ